MTLLSGRVGGSWIISQSIGFFIVTILSGLNSTHRISYRMWL